MELIRPGDPTYNEDRTIFNAMIDRRPAVIAKCATPDHVASALDLARRERYEVAARAGGHSVAGVSLDDGGLVIDVRPMKAIEVDAPGRRIRVGAGVTWGEFDANIAWARGFRRDIARYTNGGVYLNFIGDGGQDRIRAAYGPANYDRPAGIKAEWDPGNVFRGNQNIQPGLTGRPG